MGFCCTDRHGSNLESQIREPPTGFHRVKPIPFWWNNIESNGFHFQGDFCCFIFRGGGVMIIVNLTDTFRWWRFWYFKLYFSIFFALHWGDDCPNWLTPIFSKRVCSTTNYYWGISNRFYSLWRSRVKSPTWTVGPVANSRRFQDLWGLN